MEKLNLNAQIRSTEWKISEIRAEKMIPSVVYGHHQEALSIKIDNSEFLKLFRVSGESSIINLDLEGKNIEVLVHEVQKHPVSWDFLHVDFYALTRGEKLTTKVSLDFTGKSKAVTEWAILDEHIKEIEVKVLPKDLVDSINVDLSKLENIGDSLKISDLGIDSSKIEVLTTDTVVVSATKPAKVEEISNEAPDAPVTGADEKGTEEK